MDKPIYSVFAYDGGDSKSIGNATDSYRDACKIASDFFNIMILKLLLMSAISKLVKSAVHFDVVSYES